MSTWAEVLVRVAEDAVADVRRRLVASAPGVTERLRPLVVAAFRSTREYGELADGPLRREFGLRDGKLAAESVAEAVAEAVGWERLPDGVLFYAVAEDFGDAARAKLAVYPSQSRRRAGPFPVPWLEWYLFRGGEAVAPGFGLVWKTGVRGRASKTDQGQRYVGSRTSPLMMPLRGRIQQEYLVPDGGPAWLREVANRVRPRFIALLEEEAAALAAA